MLRAKGVASGRKKSKTGTKASDHAKLLIAGVGSVCTRSVAGRRNPRYVKLRNGGTGPDETTSDTSDEASSRINPEASAILPNRLKLRRGGDKPSLRKSQAGIAKPTFASDRTSNARSSCRKSVVGTEGPGLAELRAGDAGPRQA